MGEDYVKIYFVRGPKGYAKFESAGHVQFYSDIGSADPFPSEPAAQYAIGKVSRFNHISSIIDCTVICGEFVPKEGFKAIDLIFNIPRWKKLYNILVENCTVAELLLFTGAESTKKVSEHPVYEHIKKIKSQGFVNWQHDKSSWRDGKEEAFLCFKMICRYAMNEKFKEKQAQQ